MESNTAMSNAGERGPLDDPETRPAFGRGSVRKRDREREKKKKGSVI